MEALPFVDELSASCTAPAGRLWQSLITSLPGSSAGGSILARVLGCDPAAGTPTFTGTSGDAVPGFRVVEAEPGRRLVLEGRHRFSRYRLEFHTDDGRLRARTSAAFPGWTGRLYRAAVIASGAHRLVTRTWIGRIARHAERGSRQTGP
jgi:hypothetical protein